MIEVLQLFEKAYFAELERKTQLNNALAFPLSVIFGGVALLGYASSYIEPESPGGAIAASLLFLVTSSLALFIKNVWAFSIHDDYEYIWFMDQTLEFRNELRAYFDRQKHQEKADDQFSERLIADLAKCASVNARLNDQRAHHMYLCRIHSLFFILGCFLLSVVGAITEMSRS
ncbi:MAG: hypothetical protein AAF127_04080 [Pseudomonadota bacterium]